VRFNRCSFSPFSTLEYRQIIGQPHQLNVALSLALETATGRDAAEVAVDVDFQQVGRMVGRPVGFRWDDTFKALRAKVEFIDENIDDALPG
jgi:hypothetical protein